MHKESKEASTTRLPPSVSAVSSVALRPRESENDALSRASEFLIELGALHSEAGA